MTVRIKEIVIRYEDDGELSPLTALEHKEKYRPLELRVHHHCSPPPNQSPASDSSTESEPKVISIDLNEMAQAEKGE